MDTSMELKRLFDFCLFICLFIYLFIYLLMYLFLRAYSFTYRFIYLSIYLSILVYADRKQSKNVRQKFLGGCVVLNKIT